MSALADSSPLRSILSPMSSDDDDGPAGRLFGMVIVCEVVAVAALWICGRIFS
jgi:hypothetical protein